MHIMWIEFGCAVFIAAICVPLALRMVPKNMFYGMRTTKTMNGSDEDWYEVNRTVGMAMLLSSLVAGALILASGLLPLTELNQSFLSMALLLVAVFLPIAIYRKRLM